MRNSQHQQIENDIASVVLTLSERSSEIDPDHVTDLVIQQYNPNNSTNIYMFYLGRQGLRKMVGEYIARAFDPIKRLKENIQSGNIDQIDAFSDQLQDFYPVKRTGDDGKKHLKYISRHNLTQHECIQIGKRFKRAAASLNQHGDNLIAFGMQQAA